MAEIRIANKLFQERVSHLVTAWKNDIRAKDGLFGGASSLLIMMGKVEEVPEFHKNNAMHVSVNCCPGCFAPSIYNQLLTSDSFGFLATSFPRR